MSIEVKVPALPESVSEATVADWHKQAGDAVSRDENLVDLETDKVVLEVPAIADGTLLKIVVEAGATVTAGDVLAILETGAASQSLPAAVPATASPAASDSAEVQQSPAVRRLLAEHNLDASEIPASGKGGRLVKADVEQYLAQQPTTSAQAPSAAPAAPPVVQPAAVTPPAVAGTARVEQRVPMTRIRARIAERLVEAQHNAAMLSTFNEVDLSAVGALRQRYREQFEKSHDIRLGYMSFFVKAAVEALKRYPVVNASVDGSDIIYHGYYDIGIAVSSPRGLVVPILRDADKLSFGEVEGAIRDFGKRAKDNKLSMDDLLGGTFSITNGGVFGSMLSTPILNPPQSAILGMHGINERPMVVDGEIVIRPMMYLAMTYDHRIIDGREAVLFLRTIKEVLEDPARMLLEI